MRAALPAAVRRGGRHVQGRGAAARSSVPDDGRASGAAADSGAAGDSGAGGPAAAAAAAAASSSGRPASPALAAALRSAHAAEAGAAAFFGAQSACLRQRPDAAFYSQEARARLAGAAGRLAGRRVRPSALLPAARLLGSLLGAAAAVAPPPLRLAVAGALQEALSEHFNDSLRQLREEAAGGGGGGGGAGAPEDVRAALRQLRDAERAPEGAPPPPDLIALQQLERLEDVGVAGAVGAAVKFAVSRAVAASEKV